MVGVAGHFLTRANILGAARGTCNTNDRAHHHPICEELCGFLGLDNITVIDRSEKLSGGAVLEQSDTTGWMGMFCLNLMRIALELAGENKVYESLALKFFEHYIYIGAPMKNMGGRKYSLWDDNHGFFCDVLRFPDGSFHRFRVRSLVGIVPLYAAETLKLSDIENFHEFKTNFLWFVKNRKELTDSCCHFIERNNQYELTIVDEPQLRRLLERLLSPEEFLSDFGIRSLSKYHGQHPFVFEQGEVRYDPAESENKIKGGNSNWRGPIWFPTTFLIIEGLRTLGAGYGSVFQMSIPGDSNGERNLLEIAGEVANRMIRIFTRDEQGMRLGYGGTKKVMKMLAVVKIVAVNIKVLYREVVIWELRKLQLPDRAIAKCETENEF